MLMRSTKEAGEIAQWFRACICLVCAPLKEDLNHVPNTYIRKFTPAYNSRCMCSDTQYYSIWACVLMETHTGSITKEAHRRPLLNVVAYFSFFLWIELPKFGVFRSPHRRRYFLGYIITELHLVSFLSIATTEFGNYNIWFSAILMPKSRIAGC